MSHLVLKLNESSFFIYQSLFYARCVQSNAIFYCKSLANPPAAMSVVIISSEYLEVNIRSFSLLSMKKQTEYL